MRKYQSRGFSGFCSVNVMVLMVFLFFIGAIISLSPAAAAAPAPDESTNYINVKNFGSKGDGKTDDTAAIQAAIDSIPLFWNELKEPQKFPQGKVNRYTINQPYVLFFPAGTYRVSKSLRANFRNRLTIMGYGARVIWDGSEFGTLFDLRNSNLLTVKGFFIDGNGRLGTALRFGVSAEGFKDFMNANVTGIHVEDVTVKWIINRDRPAEKRQPVIDTIGDYSRPYLTSVQDSLFENVILETGGDIGYSVGTTEVRFVGGVIAGLKEGVRFYTGSSASFYGVTFTGGADTHISIFGNNRLDSLRFYGVYFEEYRSALIKEVGSPTKRMDLNMLLFDGCFFSNQAPEFISLQNKTVNLYLMGNRYYKNPTFSKFRVAVGDGSNVLVAENYLADDSSPSFSGGSVMKISGGLIEKDGMTLGYSDTEPEKPCTEGSIRFNKKPRAGGYGGWICADVAGRPEWRSFGKIE